MARAARIFFAAWWFICLGEPLCAQTPPAYYPGEQVPPLLQSDLPLPEQPITPAQSPAAEPEPGDDKPSPPPVNHQAFNRLYNKPRVNEKKELRLAWEKTFGVDVWYPYYKAKEIEDWVSDRMSVKVFKLKGKPKFERGQVRYIFRTAF